MVNISEKRSLNMSHIKSKNTSIEMLVRKFLYNNGFRYRKNVKDLPGKPDIVISKYKTVIFINGCFWHHHFNCKYATLPKTREEYWIPKIEKNVERDLVNYRKLKQLDYKVIVVWECELKKAFDSRMEYLIYEIKNNQEDY